MPNNYLQKNAMTRLKNGELVRAYFRDLRGKAALYSGSYHRSWVSMEKKLLKQGFIVTTVVMEHGYLLNKAENLPLV